MTKFRPARRVDTMMNNDGNRWHGSEDPLVCFDKGSSIAFDYGAWTGIDGMVAKDPLVCFDRVSSICHRLRSVE